MKSHAPNTSSRTFFGIRNGQVGFLYYLASLFIGFISRKFFLDYLGAEFLGLNTTAENLLGILNLSELGIGMAVAYTLYKPLLQHDEGRIREIITLQGWMYRRIGCMVGMSALILMLFFPHIFSKTDLPLGYAYATFGVFLYSTLLTYFFNYKQILFSSNQQQYQIILHYQSILLFKNIVQILAFLCLPSPYISWLLLQVVFATVASAQLHRAVNKHFPFLEKSAQDARTLMKRYPHLLTQIKQVFFHRLASFALTQSSPLIIFAYANLTLVALYGNYQLICLTVQKLVDSLFTGVHAGIGHLIAENNRQRILAVFQELFSIRFLLTCVCCYCLIQLMEPFICLWIGADYVMPRSTLYLITAILYINLSRQTVETYIAAHGMYQDIAAPIIETILNLGLSCLLGYFWGIDGILSGVLISLIVVVLGWKPYFLFRFGLKCKLRIYVRTYFVHLCCLSVAYFLTEGIKQLCPIPPIHHYMQFLGIGILHFLTFGGMLYGLLWLFTPGMKAFSRRIIQLIRS